ncbi:WbqC family protein [Propionivibrio sp.]|uniref:WbqC family protein n=1 Tax=Propionivibrio sp. TaxID=2212460 RepID=UPI0025D32D78|nr:WbqC family protein [Propionivibrio sp.]MBK7357393.1 WbqC family protein [Propionivibrio sp.]MBK8743240.1 WbqC family protein [Propionivibrio sp.]MBK8894745.1 WbqC family protein [Propionivibrio sp.]
MKLAVMQPYFFPYIGYFQLMAAVDRLVILDDVNFIKQGWINRNRILVSCCPTLFSLPIRHASSFVPVYATRLVSSPIGRRKFLKTVEQAYRKAPQFEHIYRLVSEVYDPNIEFVGQLALNSILAVAQLLGVSTEIVATSRLYGNRELKAEERILDICRREKATEYFNLSGGRLLYKHKSFDDAGIKLRFLQPRQTAYRQLDCPFVPSLSIIDVMMFNEPSSVREMLNHFELT